ncbi:serine/threonine protein kinase [Actinoplanes couchii]|uniref:Protein kinase domain-containing protein n=1 Tax=Actinoplanes couchii TaxID=403638 RepID=A0ABQ3XFK8_9ACTN|nr:serine/threonine-protein kinase [Actinoplanes couchii]MDR6321783.1 serine/threonine protein kinase [Actinoplanes couchii]GID57259.1 hypothetical protein Aco03nite_056630 [Actinoplanes couchii]
MNSLGRYELLRLLGEGGMGSVWLGRDPSGTLVAIKVIKAEHARDLNFRARFRSEVNRARAVPAFCTAEVLDADPDHETPYLVVEYIDGPSLADVLRDQGPLRGGNLHSVAVGVASALVAIHSAGIVHRDLKPANVLFALGSPKVIDFGIAKALEATSHHTRPQEMVGTLSYMAPERFGADAELALTPAADIFAWGAVVAYAATGRNPFSAGDPVATAGRILTQPPNLDGLPPSLAGIVERALAKDPTQRPTAQELLLELTAAPSADTSPIPDDPHQVTTVVRDLPGRPAAAQRRGRSTAQHPGQSAEQHPGQSAAQRPGRPPEQRPGRWRVVTAAAVGALLLTVAGAWVGTSLSDNEKNAVPSGAAPSSAVPSSAVRLSATELFDPLTGPALWKPFIDENSGGVCDFDGGLVIRTEFMTQCEAGPEQAFKGDTTIEVHAELDKQACAMIWFRLSPERGNGYIAGVCSYNVSVSHLNDGVLDQSDQLVVSEGTMSKLDIEDNGPHVIRVEVINNFAKISVDGRTILTSDLSLGNAKGARHTKGKVTFGASGDAPTSKVTLRDAHVTVS